MFNSHIELCTIRIEQANERVHAQAGNKHVAIENNVGLPCTLRLAQLLSSQSLLARIVYEIRAQTVFAVCAR